MIAIPLVDGRPVIRRSLAEGLVGCPQFHRQDNERLAFGIAVHVFMASYWRHLQAIREETDMTAVGRLAIDAWARTPGLLPSRFDEFMALAELFAQTHFGNLSSLLSVEETMTWDAGFALLTCTTDRVDRLDGGDRDDPPTWEGIWDGKSEMGAMDHSFQARWYSQMHFLTHPSVDRVSMTFDSLRRGFPDDPITFERGDLDQWWQATTEALRLRLLNPRAVPTGGPACYECALRRTCASADTVAKAIPETAEEADELLAEHDRHQALVEVLWSAQKEFYRDRPPREVRGEEIGVLTARDPRFRVTGTARDFWRYAVRHGMDRWSLLRPVQVANRALQDGLIVSGLGEMAYGSPEFRRRKVEPEGRRLRREKRAAEAAGGEA